MPNFFSFASPEENDTVQEMEHEVRPKQPRRRSMLRNIGSMLKKRGDHQSTDPSLPEFVPTRGTSMPGNDMERQGVPSLSRPQPYRSHDSEKRERLLEVQQSLNERRAVSPEWRAPRVLSASAPRRPVSPNQPYKPRTSAPNVGSTEGLHMNASTGSFQRSNSQRQPEGFLSDPPPLSEPTPHDDFASIDQEAYDIEVDQTTLLEEYDRRWVLNLSMHFRDKSNREKFFVTYAETPSRWRRITVSLDYRNALAGSLESDLSDLCSQRDKSLRIYESIRESLPVIQYYNTVTNLKLETTPADGQLHVHVREDVNEIIQYPSISLFQHIHCEFFKESDIEFISHLSGFVYKVQAADKILIKKEIPGPDTVDEFLYEANALDSLIGCDHVVQLEGLVTDDTGSVVKGLLISYAPQGALVDMIYDLRGSAQFPWHRREKWAKQIVTGLSDIHEAGYVQGDFTLSNIVIDDDDNAVIIDINRRGCPVGWEPPELGRLIESGQRIGMCIGVKTDLFQLGMVLWALAEELDEPERVERPLPSITDEVPTYFRDIVETCLSKRPQGRVDAKKLLQLFPPNAGLPASGRPFVDFSSHVDLKHSDNSIANTHRSDKEYIDPDLAVTIDEVRRRRNRLDPQESDFTSGQVTSVDPVSGPASTTYRFESSGSWVIGHSRGRSLRSSRHRRGSPNGRTASSNTSLSDTLAKLPPGFPPHLGRESGFTPEDGASDSACASPSRTNLEALGAQPAAIPPSPSVPTDTNLCNRPPQSFREQSLTALPQDKRLAAAHDHEFTPFLHTDSGFDEHMIDEIELGEAASSGDRPLPPRGHHVDVSDGAGNHTNPETLL